MFWRFGFSSTSSLDTLLDRPNVSLEEILDEDELLQECKTQNAKLVNYLQQPRVLKRLFEHVVGTAEVGGPGGRDWEEKVRFKYPYIASEVLSSDIWSIIDTTLSHSDELLVIFWDAILSRGSTANPPTVTQHQHPLFAADAPTTPGFKSRSNSPHRQNAHLPTVPGGSDISNGESSASVGVLGLEVKGNDEGNTVTSARDNGPGKSVLAGYWAKVNGVFLDKKPREMISFIKSVPNVVELFVAHMETPAVVDLLYRIIQCEEAVPNIGVIDWLSSQDLMSRLIDLLSPTHSTDLHNTVSELLKAIIALSAPSPASLTQAAGTEAFGFGGEMGNNHANGQVGGVNNRLVRELASEAIVRKMVSFMLDASLSSRLSRRLSEAAEEQQQPTSSSIEGAQGSRSRPSVVGANRSKLSALDEGAGSSDDSALEDDELEFEAGMSRRPLNPRDTPASEQSLTRMAGSVFDQHRDSTATIRPSASSLTPVHAPEIVVSPESCTSTLVTCIGVLIELIRKNNSDYFEQHLFHTLRTHLLQRQQEIAERKANRTVSATETNDEESQTDAEGQQREQLQSPDDEDDDEMEGMEEAMAELSDKLGIVHLGPMLRVLCERLSDFQELVARPRVEATTKTVNSLGVTPALTFERYRITELYAELLHCSNMALLNRQPGEGPQYSDEGVLQGGIEGLQILARTLQGTDAASDSGQDHSTAEQTVRTEGAGEAGVARVTEPSALEEGTTAQSQEPEHSSSNKAGGRHTRESSITGGVGSEDTDDEALLSEVSLSEASDEAESKERVTALASATDDATTDQTTASPSSKESSGKEKVDEGTVDQDDEIKSVLSHLSLADLTSPSPAPSGPPSPMDDGRAYVVGDLLKRKFLECDVIPTILSLFFAFPWNNFLHNVVYDILQQFFNGRMDVGLNRRLTLAVFEQGGLPDKIVAGHRRNEESLQSPRRIRMGYMGHMHLIAEETVKLLERYPQEIARFVQPFLSDDWTHFVEETLKENREREAGPLAGGRPQIHSLAFPQHSSLSGSLGNNDPDNGNGGVGQSANSEPFASYLSSQIGAASASDDDDSDEDSNWLSQDMRQRGSNDAHHLEGAASGFDDAFAPTGDSFQNGTGGFHSGANDDDDDDDDWGPFADSSESVVSSAHAYQTPADLAADFQREASANDARPRAETEDEDEEVDEDDDDDIEEADDSSTSTASGNDHRTLGLASTGRARSDSGGSDASGTQFVDLLDNASVRATDVVAAAHARRPSLGQYEATPSPETLRIARPRSSSDSSSAADAAQTPEEPLGPGVSPDAQADPVSGMIERVIDGETVKVPLDEVALVGSPPRPTGERALEE